MIIILKFSSLCIIFVSFKLLLLYLFVCSDLCFSYERFPQMSADPWLLTFKSRALKYWWEFCVCIHVYMCVYANVCACVCAAGKGWLLFVGFIVKWSAWYVSFQRCFVVSITYTLHSTFSNHQPNKWLRQGLTKKGKRQVKVCQGARESQTLKVLPHTLFVNLKMEKSALVLRGLIDTTLTKW